jgi:phosphoribosylcarboxyaminoimidazole (NCAIR) mutase
MKLLKDLWHSAEFVVEYHADKLGIDTRDESGAVSTETAVVTGILVTIAVAGGAIILRQMTNNANNIPVNSP